MTRTEFMDHFERYLANALQRDSVTRQGDNNVQATFFDDVHIGVVTKEKGDAEVRCHIWTQDDSRRARWRAVRTISATPPPGLTLEFRDGPRETTSYLEYNKWPNSTEKVYASFVNPVEQAIDYFVTNQNLIP
tara:strand:- start:6821 stop:7219 length:399 start_codon:yes stop_codon:yes gene_type:complete